MPQRVFKSLFNSFLRKSHFSSHFRCQPIDRNHSYSSTVSISSIAIISEATVKIVVLKDRSLWADWFDALRRVAGNKGIWDKINPFNNKAIETNMAAPPRPPYTIDELILKETEDHCTRYRVETENWDKDTRPMVEKGSKPVSL